MTQVTTTNPFISILIEKVFRDKGLKSIGRRRDSDFNTTYDTFTASFFSVGGGKDTKANWRAKQKYKKVKVSLDTKMTASFKKFQDGKLGEKGLVNAWMKARREAYEEAMVLGATWAGNPFYKDIGITPEDRKYLEKAVRYENRFAKKFVSDMVNERGRMDYARRLQMYVNTLDSMFWYGFVLGKPKGTRFYWTLHPAESCVDCLAWGAESRTVGGYTRETLPSTPRAGDSRCRSNCMCSLTVVRKRKNK